MLQKHEIPAVEFFTGYETILEPDELVTKVAIPPQLPDIGVSYI